MSDTGLLASHENEEAPSFSFTKADRDKDSKRNPLDSMTVQGVTSSGRVFSKARIPLDDQGRAVLSEDVFGSDTELAWLVANLLDEEGWEYVES